MFYRSERLSEVARKFKNGCGKMEKRVSCIDWFFSADEEV
jgi:hypothetical protein